MNLLLLQLRNQTTFPRKTVYYGLYIDKTCVPDVFSGESPLNTDTRIIRTLWHASLVYVFTGFHFMKTSILQTFSLTAFQCVKNTVYLAINVSFNALYLFKCNT